MDRAMILLVLGCTGPGKPDVPEPEDTGTVVDTSPADSARDTGDTPDPDDTAPCTPTAWYADADGDGWGTGVAVESCEAPGAAWATQDGDCDDAASTTYPGANYEPCGEGVDRNCDGAVNGEDACDLSLDADHVLTASDELPGAAIAWADVDGDGRDDVVLGLPGSECNNGGDAGTAHVFTAGAWSERELTIETDANVVIEGFNDLWCFARSVARAGDVDGDGLDDLVVGEPAISPEWDAYANWAPGTVYLFLGSQLQPTLSAGDAAAIVEATGIYDAFGAIVGAIGDVDGDGFDDVYASKGPTGPAAPHLLLGSSLLTGEGELDAIVLPYTERVDVHRGVPGDIDGDGLYDIVTASATVYLGASLVRGVELAEEDADFAIGDDGGAYGAWGQVSVDLDGDGNEEVLAIADASADSWAIYGAADFERAAEPAAITAEDAGLVLEFGDFVVLQSHGDIDGDAEADLLVYVVDRGRPERYGIVAGATLPESGTFTIEGFDTSWTAPDALAGTNWQARADGDLDGDGVHEILLGTSAEYALVLRDW